MFLLGLELGTPFLCPLPVITMNVYIYIYNETNQDVEEVVLHEDAEPKVHTRCMRGAHEVHVDVEMTPTSHSA